MQLNGKDLGICIDPKEANIMVDTRLVVTK